MAWALLDEDGLFPGCRPKTEKPAKARGLHAQGLKLVPPTGIEPVSMALRRRSFYPLDYGVTGMILPARFGGSA